jgi:hypothetical protein
VWGLLAFATMIAIIVLFATGVGEVATILAGASAVVVLAVRAALRAAGRDPGPVAANDQGSAEGEGPVTLNDQGNPGDQDSAVA